MHDIVRLSFQMYLILLFLNGCPILITLTALAGILRLILVEKTYNTKLYSKKHCYNLRLFFYSFIYLFKLEDKLAPYGTVRMPSYAGKPVVGVCIKLVGKIQDSCSYSAKKLCK